MKILLAACNAKYIHSNLAVYDLKAYSSDYDEQVLLREYTINQPKDEILKDIYSSGADVVCFSCYIWNISFVRELIRDLAKILPETVYWAGGPEVSYDAEKFLTEMPELYIDGKGSLEEISGIAYRNGDKICHNGWRELMDLSEIPFVYEHLEDFENRIIYYESSRGCPFSCSYCLSSIDKHEHAMTIWKYILEHDNGVTNFHFEISADLLREEEMDLMEHMRPGLIQLEIGVQSTNPETIRAIHRHMDLEKLERCVDRVHSFRNIHQHLDLIAGLPYEDYDTFHRSFNDVYRMKPDQLQLGFLKVLKGSLMQKEAEGYGIIHKEKEPYEVLSTNWLTYGEVLKLKMVESMVEVYYNSGQFQHTLEYLVPFAEDAFTFYEQLGAFYEKKGYSEISHSRMRRYEILLEFLREETEIPVRTAAQKMLYDLYLREKLKKRPVFAPDQKVYETDVWNYRKNNQIPKTAHIEVFEDGSVVLFDYERRDPLSNNAHTELTQL